MNTKMTRKFLCIQSHYGSKGAFVQWCDIDDKGFVGGETPVEDFGMFLLLDEEISKESAARLFIALLGHSEGEEPEIKDIITDDDRLFRSVLSAALLTREEYEIYLNLISDQGKHS